MNIITQAETDNIGYCYIPFLYHDEFPGMDIKFPNGVKILKVHNKNLQFLPSIQNHKYDSKQFNKLIHEIFDEAQKTKAFSSMSFKIAQPAIQPLEGQISNIELTMYPTSKPILPSIDEIMSWRGVYLHLQMNNLFKNGERITSGVQINQRNFTYLTKLRFPLSQSSFKIRIGQSKNLHTDNLPTKFFDLRLHETILDVVNHKQYIDYSVRMQQRSNISNIENGFRVQCLFDSQSQDIESLWLKQRQRLGVSLNLWAASNQSDVNLKYNYQYQINLQKLWPQKIKNYLFNVWVNKFEIETNIVQTNQMVEEISNKKNNQAHSYLQGFSLLGGRNKFCIQNYSRFYIKPTQPLRAYNIYPFLSTSLAYQSGNNKTNASLGIGLQIPFIKKYRLFLQYNLIHMYSNKDKILTTEIYLQ